LVSALFSALILAGGAFAQETVDAQVPVLVNVNASVKIDPPNPSPQGAAGAEGSVTGGTQQTFNIKLAETGGGQNTSASYRPQRLANAGAWASYSRGNVTLNLQPGLYQNAVVSLHSVNGKRILNSKVSASGVASKISRSSVPAGVYLLSVKGINGNSFSTRLTHSGEMLNINVAFGSENIAQLNKSAAVDNYGEWRITVSAAGYATQTRTFSPVAGANPTQSFTMAAAPTASNFTQAVGTGSSAVNFEMIYVPGGTFTIGCERPSGCPADTGPVSGVRVSSYYISRTTVTAALYRAVMGTGSTTGNPQIDWYDAMEFACKLSEMTGRNYRMTTEAEWEYAAKNHSGGTGMTIGSTEEWAYNSWSGTHSGGTDPVGSGSGEHTQKTRRNGQGVSDNVTARFIRSIEGYGPALRLALSADSDFPPNYVPPCNLKAPKMGDEPVNSYRDPRWVTGSGSRWRAGSIAIGQFDLRVWEDGTARMGTTNGQWFTSNNIIFVFVPATGAIRTFPYIFVDETQGSLISNQSFMSGGFIGRIQKETTTNLDKPAVANLRSGRDLAVAATQAATVAGESYMMVNMENIPQSARGQDARLLDGTSHGWFQDNRSAGGIHHYRKDIDLDEFRFTVNQAPSQRTILANGTWFTVNNTFLRVTHPGSGSNPRPYVVDYLYTIAGGTLYHNSFMGYERGDFRMFERIANSDAVFGQTCGASNCGIEIPKGQAASMYAPGGFMSANGHSTFVPAACPPGGCN